MTCAFDGVAVGLGAAVVLDVFAAVCDGDFDVAAVGTEGLDSGSDACGVCAASADSALVGCASEIGCISARACLNAGLDGTAEGTADGTADGCA